MNDLKKQLPFLRPQPPRHTEFYRIAILSGENEKLTRLRDAILAWRTLTDRTFVEFRQQQEAQPNVVMADYGYDPVADEAFMLGVKAESSSGTTLFEMEEDS